VGSSYSSLPDAAPDHPLAIAHRHGNLLDLVGDAAAAGVDLLEMDVYALGHRLEVRHARVVGPWLLDGWRLRLRRHDPLTLDAVLTALPIGTGVMVDLKGWRPWTGRRVAAAMRASLPGRPYAVCSRSWRLLEAFAAEPHARVVWSAGSRRELRRLLTRLEQAPVWGVSVRRQLLSAEVVRRLRDRVRVVMAWHVDDAAALERVLALGVNAVICDDLEVLATVLQLRGG
jgi:glycerophosphoryl diester phosphodiesterase